MNPTQYKAAMGCLLGALVGDAAGATLEFFERDLTPEDVAWAMSMPGGGNLQVAPGQITDDGELTLCLARALTECDRFDLEIIARHYAEWVESRPFDMGFTTSLGVDQGISSLASHSKRIMRLSPQCAPPGFSVLCFPSINHSK